MYFGDLYDPNENNNIAIVNDEHKVIIGETKSMDIGYNTITREIIRTDGRRKNVKIDLYSSNGTGKCIRDAETGVYYKNLVGSKDEDLFFKVSLATGECNSKNGSTTFFYISPTHYMSHMNCQVSPEIIQNWESKRNARLNEVKNQSRPRLSKTIIN
jgi:hypothetical protein